MARVLNIDGDYASRRTRHAGLLAAGFDVVDAETPEQAIALCRIQKCDILLLDVKPFELGVKECQTLRQAVPRAAIVVLSDIHPRRAVRVLAAGADQCFVKTIALTELIAHLPAAHRPL